MVRGIRLGGREGEVVRKHFPRNRQEIEMRRGCRLCCWRRLFLRMLRRYALFIIQSLSYDSLFAQEYLFSVPSVGMDVTVLPSAVAVLEYRMDFENVSV